MNRKELVKKNKVSDKAIERKIGSKSGLLKKNSTISTTIQLEIIDALQDSALFYGYNTSEWNINRVQNYISKKYKITINTRMAKTFLEKVKGVNKDYHSCIKRLKKEGYDIFLLIYLKIGTINKVEVEPLELRKFESKKLNINLEVAINENYVYLDVVFSELEITDRFPRLNFHIEKGKKEIEEERNIRKKISQDKYEALKKIKKKENKEKIIFITTHDTDIKEYGTNRKEVKYLIVKDNEFEKLLEEYKIGDEGAINLINSLYNKSREFECITRIGSTINKRINRYLKKNKAISRKTIKIIESEYI